MARAFTVSADIPRPIDVVWARLVDLDRATEWIDSLDEVACSGPVGLGTRLEAHRRGRVVSSEVTEFDEGAHLIELTSRSGRITARYRYRCEATASANTRVTLTGTCSASGPLGLFSPLIVARMEREDGDQLTDLRAVLDADAGPHRHAAD